MKLQMQVFVAVLAFMVSCCLGQGGVRAPMRPGPIARPMPPYYPPRPDDNKNETVKYVVTFPAVIDKSKDFKLNMILFSDPSVKLPVSFTANLTNGGSTITSQTFTQTQFGLQQHVFSNVKSATISDDSYPSVQISFNTDGLSNYTDISGSERVIAQKFVFIQTDKMVYKPTQTVNFRVVVLDRKMQPVAGSLSFSIQDPKNSQLKAWKNQQLTNGVVNGSYKLSDFVTLGNWKISVSGSNGIPSTDQTFEVQQYVLPKFEVKLDFTQSNKNGYWLYNNNDESSYSGSVQAKYTFGKSVKGSAVLTLSSTGGCNYTYDNPYWYSFGPMAARKNITKITMTATLLGDGSANDGKFLLQGLNDLVTNQNYIMPPPRPIPIPMAAGSNVASAVVASPPVASQQQKKMSSQQCQLTFQVNVTEELTGEKIVSEGNVMLYRDPYTISVHDSVQKTLKPGLPFTMRFQISTPDGSPVGGNVKTSLQAYFWDNDNAFQSSRVSCGSWGYFNSDSAPPQPNVTTTATTDSDGTVSIKADIPKGVTSVLFKASIADVSGIEFCESRSPPQTYSHQAVSISMDRSPAAAKTMPKVGDKLTFKIAATFKVPMVYFMVAQNGQPFVYNQLSNPVSIDDMSTKFSVNVTLPSDAAPRCVAVVWTVENSTGEILADAVEFKVDGLLRQNVSASFSPALVHPHDSTTLTVRTTEPNSFVALLAVDKSVRLLKSGNDIQLDDVLSAVGSGNSGGSGGYRPIMPLLWRCWRCGWWPSWVDSSSADNVFQGAGMVIKSNVRTGYITIYPVLFGAMGRVGGGDMMPVPMMAPGNARAPIPVFDAQDTWFNRDVGSRAAAAPAPAPRVRLLFPETWIWNSSQTDGAGSLSMALTAPDTITTWMLTAFSVGPSYGFGAMESPAELTVFQDFFVNLDISHPTIIRGEQVQIKAVIFNYQSSDATVDLVLKKSADFNVSFDNVTYTSSDFQKQVTVKANSGSSVPIWIVPTTLGTIKMNLVGTGSAYSDAMIKEVLVQPEGEIRYANKPVFIRLTSGKPTNMTIDVQKMLGDVTDGQVVAGSKLFQLQAIGDILGPALSQLGSQIRMPTGCGEQTMIILAPNVYIYKYLKAVNLLTDDLSAKTTSFVDQGYQRELTYQRSDGGFSAFGNSDTASSTWLTAFVLRSFAAAQKYINAQISSVPVTSAWNFIQKQATSDGKFTEPGHVIHTDMKGGAGSDLNLAAYIYATAAEANVDAKTLPSIAATKQLLLSTGRNNATRDTYQLALITYALSIRPEDRPFGKDVMKRLVALASHDGGVTYWKPAKQQSSTKDDEYTRSGPSQIETSAYALLAMLNLNGMTDDAVPIGRWLMSQRNSLGGFSSTQDTVVGLQALSELASVMTSGGQNFVVSATLNFDDEDPISTSFSINSDNAQVLQSYDPPRDMQSLKSVNISVTGTGVGLVQLALQYNVKDQQVLDSGDYTIIVTRVAMARRKRREAAADNNELGTNDNDVLLKACAQPSNLVPGMTLVEVGIPTGFEGSLAGTQDANKLSDGNFKAPLKRIELSSDRKMVFYFDGLDDVKQQVCVMVKLTRTGAAKNVQPAIARVYNYYGPSHIKASEYTFPGMSLDDTTACQDTSLNIPCPN